MKQALVSSYKTVITVATAGDLNGKSKAKAADDTAAKLREEMADYARLGYRQDSIISVDYKASGMGMRWVAKVKMAKP